MKKILVLTLVAGLMFYSNSFAATRIKDIARIDGVRSNQLYGYGLVIGLNGTGDRQASFTAQSIGNMLRRLGINIPAADVATQVRSRNVAAVIVTADLPAYAKPGTRIGVTISSINDATSLSGGVLVQTPLLAADGNVYAVAQGNVSTGLSAGTRITATGPLNVARIPGGALVEKEVPSTIIKNGTISIILNNPDFSTADRVIQSINTSFKGDLAKATDAGTIKVDMPDVYKDNIVKLIAQIESLSVNPDTVAKVIINERTGTVVVGRDVRISAVAVTHGNISVQIQNSFETTISTVQASTYPPEGRLMSNSVGTTIQGEGVVTKEGFPQVVALPEGTDINELVKALNSLGVSPKDLIAILQAIKEAGALQAEIEVI